MNINNPIELVQSVRLPLSKIETNKGQIEGLPQNPRFIRDEKFKKLVQSIKDNPEMTALREVLVYPHAGKYVIIGGNMRYQALKELGYIEAICKVLPESTTPEQLQAYTIKDNAGFGEWDFDLLANDWEAGLLCDCGVDVPEVDAEAQEDEAEMAREDDYEPVIDREANARTQYGDIFQLGAHRLICGDSTDAETYNQLLGGGEADLLITDPPYNVDYSSKNEALNKVGKGNSVQVAIKNDKKNDGDFYAFLCAFYAAACDALRASGAFYIFYAPTETRNFINAMSPQLTIKEYLIWAKNNFVIGRQDYQWKHEPILYGWKQGNKTHSAHTWRGGRAQTTVIDQLPKLENVEKMNKNEMADILKKIIANVEPSIIFCEKPQRSELHPTMKPIKLFARLISNSSYPDDIVLDAFGGSGTTLIACEQLKRKARLIELDRHYCDVIIDRWEKQTGEKAVLLCNVADKIKPQDATEN